MMTRNEVIEWLKSLPETAQVAIDEGGLALVVIDPSRKKWDCDYCEIGGEPEQYDED